MISEFLLNAITAVACGLTASSLLTAITKVLHKHKYIKETEYNLKLQKFKLELDKQLLELEEMQKQIEVEGKENENIEKYEKVKTYTRESTLVCCGNIDCNWK